MRVTVFCEGFDVCVSEVPNCGIEIAFKHSGDDGLEQYAVIDYDKAAELAKAIKFITKGSCGLEVPF
jgi:hypothetical protein